MMEIVNTQLSKEYLLPKYKNINGARATNKIKFPDGYIYIVKLNSHNIYKIGVSQKPKRRIQDINSYSPFGISVVGVYSFKNVYEVEEMIHDNLKDLHLRKEWFKISDEHILSIKNDLQEYQDEGLYLEKKELNHVLEI